MRFAMPLAMLLVVFDQISKWYVVEKIMRPEGVEATPFFTHKVIEVTSFFNIVMAWNRGVSFGIFNTASPYNAYVLSGLALAIVIGLLMWLRKAETAMTQLALGLIIGGALGNVVDRLRWGAVADFLDVHAFGMHWPAFNVADSAITLGAVILIAESLSAGRDSHKNRV